MTRLDYWIYHTDINNRMFIFGVLKNVFEKEFLDRSVEVYKFNISRFFSKNKYKNKDWLFKQYWVNNLSSYKIGRLCSRSHSTILYWMRKFNIPRRSNTEIVRLCEYGCGQRAYYQLRNGKWCCSIRAINCPGVKSRISLRLKLSCKRRTDLRQQRKWKEFTSRNKKLFINNVKNLNRSLNWFLNRTKKLVWILIGMVIVFPIQNIGFENITELYEKDRLEAVFYARQLGYKRQDTELLKRIYDYSIRFVRPYRLMLKWIDVESEFDSTATSYMGAKGLLQLMPYTAFRTTIHILSNPDKYPVTLEECDRLSKTKVRYGEDLFNVDNNLLISNCHISILLDCSPGWRVVFAKYYSGKRYKEYLYGPYVKRISGAL